mgnify:CR=1 FL=1
MEGVVKLKGVGYRRGAFGEVGRTDLRGDDSKTDQQYQHQQPEQAQCRTLAEQVFNALTTAVALPARYIRLGSFIRDSKSWQSSGWFRMKRCTNI